MTRTKGVTPTPACRILIVDDNRNGLLARKSVLQEQGFEVDAFGLAEEALTAFAEKPYDLVITDFRMPNINGAEVIRRVKELRPNVPVILISGVADALGLNEGNTGADAVVSKSAGEVTRLVRAVDRLLRPARKPAKKPPATQSASADIRRRSSKP
ncbi:MAG TPA: response regulator [Bryobacteraceae bacterium]|nr:response regulator [Bryobacteraceae bacterium]